MSFPVGASNAWEFEGNTVDVIGGVVLTSSGGVTNPAGRTGLGLGLAAASSQYAQVASYATLRNLSKFSIEMWWKPTTLADFKTLFGWQTGAATDERIVIFTSGAGLSENNELGCSVSSGTAYNAWTNGIDPLVADAWTQIVVVFDGTVVSGDLAVQNAGRLAMFTGGTQRELSYTALATVPTTTSNTANHPLAVGRAGTGTDYPNGVADMVRIWPNVTLTSANVTYLWNGGAGVPLGGAFSGSPASSAAMSPAFSPTNIPHFLL
jgi:hypothetical protein